MTGLKTLATFGWEKIYGCGHWRPILINFHYEIKYEMWKFRQIFIKYENKIASSFYREIIGNN